MLRNDGKDRNASLNDLSTEGFVYMSQYFMEAEGLVYMSQYFMEAFK